MLMASRARACASSCATWPRTCRRPPRRAGRPGPGRSGRERAAWRRTARRPPGWRPGSAWASRCATRWRTPTSAGTARGIPDGLAGEEVPIAVRIVTVARDAELWDRQAGWPTAAEVLAHRRGRGYDPAVVDVLIAAGRALARRDRRRPCAAVLDAEPAPVLTIDEAEIDARSPRGRLRRPEVAVLPGPLAGRGRPGGRRGRRRRAVRTTTPSVWPGRPGARRRPRRRAQRDLGPARAAQRRAVGAGPAPPLPRRAGAAPAARSSPRSPSWPPATTSGPTAPATTAVAGDQLDLAARLLAAADAYHAMTEDRPHRPALAPADAASQLLDEVDAGRFGRVEVDAVLAAAGQASRPAPPGPPGSPSARSTCCA